MTLIFGNFPHPPDMSGGVENSQTSIFLHRLVCGNPRLKKFLVRSIRNKKQCVLLFGCFLFVCFCMIWSYIIIFSTPEHRKRHLNLKWGDSIFWFRPISCTHFATPQLMQVSLAPMSLRWLVDPSNFWISIAPKHFCATVVLCKLGWVKTGKVAVVVRLHFNMKSSQLQSKRFCPWPCQPGVVGSFATIGHSTFSIKWQLTDKNHSRMK